MADVFYEELITIFNGYSDKIAFEYLDGDEVISKTYNELIADIDSCIDLLLRYGIKNRRIGFYASNSYEWVVFSVACVAINNLIFLFDSSVENIEKQYIETYKVDFIISDKNGLLEEQLFRYGKLTVYIGFNYNYSDIADEIANFVLFTSGSTGEPKGLLISSVNMLRAIGSVGKHFNSYDNTILTLPLNHIYGFACVTFAHLIRGEKVFISRGIKYLSRELVKFNPSSIFMVPTLLYSYFDLNIKYCHSVERVFGNKLSAIYVGGGKLDQSYVSKYNSIGITVMNGYGCSELCGCVSIMDEKCTELDSVGRVFENIEAKIEDGEILIRSPYRMMGYYDGNDLTDPFDDGWYRTGDLGRLEDGYLFVDGRVNGLIALPNGKNIHGSWLMEQITKIQGVVDTYIESGKKGLKVVVVSEESVDVNNIKENLNSLNSGLPAYSKIMEVEYLVGGNDL